MHRALMTLPLLFAFVVLPVSCNKQSDNLVQVLQARSAITSLHCLMIPVP